MDLDARKVEVAALIFLILAGFSCSRKKPRISEITIEASRLPVQEFFDSTRLTLTEKDRKIWTLKTTHIIKYRKDGYIYMNPVEIDYFLEKGKSHLTADSGKISEKMDTLIAMGTVRIKTDQGRRVRTTYMAWHQKTNKVTSPAFVRMDTPGGDVYSGTGFIANTDLSEWRILKNVRAEIQNVRKKMDTP